MLIDTQQTISYLLDFRCAIEVGITVLMPQLGQVDCDADERSIYLYLISRVNAIQEAIQQKNYASLAKSDRYLLNEIVTEYSAEQVQVDTLRNLPASIPSAPPFPAGDIFLHRVKEAAQTSEVPHVADIASDENGERDQTLLCLSQLCHAFALAPKIFPASDQFSKLTKLAHKVENVTNGKHLWTKKTKRFYREIFCRYMDLWQRVRNVNDQSMEECTLPLKNKGFIDGEEFLAYAPKNKRERLEIDDPMEQGEDPEVLSEQFSYLELCHPSGTE